MEPRLARLDSRRAVALAEAAGAAPGTDAPPLVIATGSTRPVRRAPWPAALLTAAVTLGGLLPGVPVPSPDPLGMLPRSLAPSDRAAFVRKAAF